MSFGSFRVVDQDVRGTVSAEYGDPRRARRRHGRRSIIHGITWRVVGVEATLFSEADNNVAKINVQAAYF